jgi:hypothetical protein
MSEDTNDKTELRFPKEMVDEMIVRLSDELEERVEKERVQVIVNTSVRGLFEVARNYDRAFFDAFFSMVILKIVGLSESLSGREELRASVERIRTGSRASARTTSRTPHEGRQDASAGLS